MRYRERQKATFMPLVKVRWRWFNGVSYRPTHTGTRWLMFGLLPVWQKRDKAK